MIATLIVNESEAAALATAVRLAGGSRGVRRGGSSGDRRPRGRRHPGRGRCDQRPRPRPDSRPRAKRRGHRHDRRRRRICRRVRRRPRRRRRPSEGAFHRNRGRFAGVHDARCAAGASGTRCDRRVVTFGYITTRTALLDCRFLRRESDGATILAGGPALCGGFRAGASDYTDIWFNPSEQSTGGGGWGVNVVQSDAFLFLTFFIYGPDNKPTWYVAGLTRDANGNFNGPLYATTGTYFGAPWNPADGAGSAQVGTASFNPTSPVHCQPDLCAQRRPKRRQGHPAPGVDVDSARRLLQRHAGRQLLELQQQLRLYRPVRPRRLATDGQHADFQLRVQRQRLELHLIGHI